MIYPLVFIRVTKVYAVPPVCTAYWTTTDWERTARYVPETLCFDALGFTWLATGARDTRGRLLYRSVNPKETLCENA